MGLLGPNGAGKTTTMLLLATLLSPSRGTARLFGHDIVRERPAIRRLLGLVFQEPSIDGLLTVRENLLFAARLAGLAARDARQAVADSPIILSTIILSFSIRCPTQVSIPKPLI